MTQPQAVDESATAAGSVLRATGVSKVYPVPRGSGERAHPALDSVDIAVRPGEVLGVVGESGSGKSTLARVLLMLERPTSGQLHFHQRRIDTASERELRELRRQVQIVFQDPMGSLDPRMRVRDIIAEPLRSLRIPGDHAARVRELLEAVGLPADAGRRYPHQFSGGQRQRVAIARALAPGPSVLVADEAVSALDVSVRAQILNLMRSLIEQLSLTMVFISHDIGVVRYLCDRVVALYQGTVVESGPAQVLLSAPAHPYTKALVDAVPRIGQPVAQRGALSAGDSEQVQARGCVFAPRCPLVHDECHHTAPQLRTRGGAADHEVACHTPLDEQSSESQQVQ
jgi:peptide/nickel transport system ATP-binding protein